VGGEERGGEGKREEGDGERRQREERTWRRDWKLESFNSVYQTLLNYDYGKHKQYLGCKRGLKRMWRANMIAWD
jgi:hypothetical protein